MTSHAAVVARGLGKPCVVGAGELDVDEQARDDAGRRQGRSARGDALSIDGTTGEVIAGALPTRPSEVLRVLLDGAEAARRARRLPQAPGVGRRRAPPARARQRRHAARRAGGRARFGAEGIGLCRTEHMFFAEERIAWVRQMILAEDDGEPRRRARQAPAHAAAGLRGDLRRPARPADHHPPARSAAPRVPAARREGAARSWPSRWGSTPPPSRRAPRRWHESNPMLGLRGCRLGITYPEIYEMQVEAIVQRRLRRASRRGVDGAAGDHGAAGRHRGRRWSACGS